MYDHLSTFCRMFPLTGDYKCLHIHSGILIPYFVAVDSFSVTCMHIELSAIFTKM